ncbi:DUF3951 domain-containing protein [Bacillus mobilis]|nr:DUF3951 domain-containing protein [Bacillus mobilis]MED0934966.1 DUF3951 domain-containing protein [Bacillus mobilis]MED0957023.1 DUF3951 domain-containing protein [Bacillus mobilis]
MLLSELPLTITYHPQLLQTFYTPFDNITWQTISIFHEEQQVLVSEDED